MNRLALTPTATRVLQRALDHTMTCLSDPTAYPPAMLCRHLNVALMYLDTLYSDALETCSTFELHLLENYHVTLALLLEDTADSYALPLCNRHTCNTF